MKHLYKKHLLSIIFIGSFTTTVEPSYKLAEGTIFTGIIAAIFTYQSITKTHSHAIDTLTNVPHVITEMSEDLQENRSESEETSEELKGLKLPFEINKDTSNHEQDCLDEEIDAMQELHIKIQMAKVFCHKIKNSDPAIQADQIPQNIITRYFRISLEKDHKNNIRAEIYRTLLDKNLEQKEIRWNTKILKHQETLVYRFSLFHHKEKKSRQLQSQATYYYPDNIKKVISCEENIKETITKIIKKNQEENEKEHTESLIYRQLLFHDGTNKTTYYYPHGKKRIISINKEFITTVWLDECGQSIEMPYKAYFP